jgi:regulatory protein YycI of two-component signal transduction system YycFG
MQTTLDIFIIIILCLTNFIIWQRYSGQISRQEDQLRKEQARAGGRQQLSP